MARRGGCAVPCRAAVAVPAPPTLSQAHEMVLRGYVPTSEETLQTLAALRLQSLNSDFSTHAPFPRLEELFPPRVLHARLSPQPQRPPKCRGARLRAGLLAGGLWGQALAKQRAERDQRLRGRLREEGASTMAAILEKWKLLQGMGRPEAMAAYVALVREWPGFGSTLFDVDLHAVRPRLGVVQEQPWPWATLTALSPQSPVGSGPQRLWLGIGAKAVSLYKPGEPEPLDSFCYGRISSFGASDSSTFRLSVEDRDLLFETSQVRSCYPSTLPSPQGCPRLSPCVPSACRWMRSPSSSTRTSPLRVPSGCPGPRSLPPVPPPRSPLCCPRGSALRPGPGSTGHQWVPPTASPAAGVGSHAGAPMASVGEQPALAGLCWPPAAPKSRGARGSCSPHCHCLPGYSLNLF